MILNWAAVNHHGASPGDARQTSAKTKSAGGLPPCEDGGVGDKTDEVAEMSDPKLWVNLDGKVVHPDAPSGGGGPGRFKSANPLGSSDHFLPGVPDPSSPDGRNVVLTDRQKQHILNADAGSDAAAPAQGPAIIVTNGWASPAGDTDRTTVGIGELSSFVVSDVAGGKWRSADGTGTTVNSVTFQWTASTAGTNKITYTAADGTTSSVTMTTKAPESLSGKKDREITTFAAGAQGAGMELTVTVSPTTVSFQALEVMEDTCNASAISGYFLSHAPPNHDAAHGASVWSPVGPKNDVSDTADSSGQPSPWSQGSYTWAIPARWRKTGSQTSGTAFSAKSNEVVTITGPDGTTIVTKLGATSAARKP
jgi:hypothetical protein